MRTTLYKHCETHVLSCFIIQRRARRAIFEDRVYKASDRDAACVLQKTDIGHVKRRRVVSCVDDDAQATHRRLIHPLASGATAVTHRHDELSDAEDKRWHRKRQCSIVVYFRHVAPPHSAVIQLLSRMAKHSNTVLKTRFLAVTLAFSFIPARGVTVLRNQRVIGAGVQSHREAHSLVLLICRTR